MKKSLPLPPKRAPLEGAPDMISRRDALTILAAFGTAAALPACRRPDEKIVPYVRQPEQIVPGNPQHFATVLPLMGTAFGVVVESHEGRPTKIEGNPLHPESLGATSSFVQASILDLYDPDRSRGPRERGAARTWRDAEAMLIGLGNSLVQEKGRGLAVITGAHRSPTFENALGDLAKACPETIFAREEPFNRDACTEGLRWLFGRPVEPVYDFSKADVILSLEADFLGFEGSSVRATLDWSARRVPERGPMNRLYVIESSMSLTGANADHRFACESASLLNFARDLFNEVATRSSRTPDPLTQAVAELKGTAANRVTATQLMAIAQDLIAHRGRSLVLASDRQPAAVHALVHYLNYSLGNVGNTVRYVRPFENATLNRTTVAEVMKAAARGSVTTLILFGVNPAYATPSDIDISTLLKSTSTSIHVGTHVDETGVLASWHLNRAHPLEAWGDAVSADGTAGIAQPLIAPLFEGRTDEEVLRLLLGTKVTGFECVQATWRKTWGPSEFDARWNRALHDGVIPNSVSESEPVEPQLASLCAGLRSVPNAPNSPYELVFHPDSHTFDGRFANNPWLLELPDPLTKLTWTNAARVSPTLARAKQLNDGDIVTLQVGDRSVHMPVVIAQGQATSTVSVSIGQGRRVGVPANKRVGVDCNPLRNSVSPYLSALSHIEKVGKILPLSRTQEHFSEEGRALARESHLGLAPQASRADAPEPPTRKEGPTVPSWGIAIDLAKCTGCSTCVVACQAENNIAVVGAEGIRRHRFMHWMRIDRYFSGSEQSPSTIAQPVLCQQCDNAPCESVCPVGATSHSPEGLNDMTYNRCVGSRYCANNCPFKTRRFNYFEYWKNVPLTFRMQLNPDVTVRSRGVMEKCTFCVQRINKTKIEQKKLNQTRIEDGAIATACEQACPARAITFGNLADARSRVASNAHSPRSYRLLDELNLDSRVFYLTRVQNPNPAL
jgi:Fe-S-cluster-containing dehydrogenase component